MYQLGKNNDNFNQPSGEAAKKQCCKSIKIPHRFTGTPYSLLNLFIAADSFIFPYSMASL